jgi:acetyltransferase-like isoleucine patch superfamily enzyme
MRSVLRLLIVLLPWALRRHALRLFYGYRLHPRSRIGRAWVFPRHLVMEAGAAIGDLTVIKGLELVSLGESATIGRLNWISAYPKGSGIHFTHLRERRPQLLLAEHAAITHRHIIDCTEQVSIGRYTTVAGYRSQILTHSIDLEECRQDAKPISIGCYCFVGTACTLLGGTVIPDYAVVAAQTLMRSVYTEPYRLYAGVPAKAVAELDPQTKYFTRERGFVV